MRSSAIGLRRHVFVGAVVSLAVLLGLVAAGSVPTVAWAATKFRSAPTPKISGTVRVGSKLTARPGTWKPRASLKYQWRLSGKSVSGARKSTWVVPASAKGKRVTVTVIGSRKGYRTTAKASKATGKAAAGVFTAPRPKISGTVRVGSRLTAKPGTWKPTASLKYQWRLSGMSVSGATKSTWVVPASAKGKRVTVTVTGSRKGYRTTAKTSKATGKAAAGVFSAPIPKISGTVRVGSKLTAKAGSWKPSATLTYQWYRAGTTITGARKSTYVLVAADAGKTIRVAVTGKRSGYATQTKKSAATGKVGSAAFTTAPIPTISGTAKIGQTLTAKPGIWKPAATLAYQWKRSGASITGAKKTTYTLTASDAGKTITVTVTGSKSGYVTTSKTSAAVKIAAAVADPPATERSALIDLYNATNGPSWDINTGWDTTASICTWTYVECTSGHVTGLILDDNQLSGSIPTTLENLTQLTNLDLGWNQLTGSIPATLGNLTQLQHLYLGVNELTGSIPTQLGNLTQLEELDLETNQLSGTLPTQLGNLTQLKVLELSDNQLSGSIPTQLGNLTQLEDLNFNTNQLSGSIPTSLGDLTQLTYLNLGWNQLTGNIPSTLGNLTQLTDLSLGFDQLSGSIPGTLGNLTELQYLYLGDNQLSGSIPGTLGNLTQLQYLYLGDNQLSGSIPSALGNLTLLTDLDLGANQLAGPMPASLQDLTKLDYVILSGNGCLTASGSLATWLTSLDSGWSDGCTK